MAVDLAKRLRLHMGEVGRNPARDSALQSRLRIHKENGTLPTMNPIFQYPNEAMALEAEECRIRAMLEEGHKLCNVQMGKRWTQESKDRAGTISARHWNRVITGYCGSHWCKGHANTRTSYRMERC